MSSETLHDAAALDEEDDVAKRSDAAHAMESSDRLEMVVRKKDIGPAAGDGWIAPIPGLIFTAIPGTSYQLLTFDPEAHIHAQDPQNRSSLQKYSLTLAAAVLVMNTALASSTPSGAAEYISNELGGNPALVLSFYVLGFCAGPFCSAPLSEYYGRRIVFVYGTGIYTLLSTACIFAPNLGALLALRFLAGVAGAVPTTNSAGLVSDILSAMQRGDAMAYYSIASFAGPAMGPPIGAFTAVYLGWRYCFVVLTAFAALLFILTFLFIPETYPPVLLSRLAKSLRQSTKNDNIVSRLDYERVIAHIVPQRERLLQDASRIFARPFQMLFTETIVGVTTAYMSFVYGLIYLLFEAYPVIFSKIHNIPPGYSSLPFLSTLVGAILSVPVALYFQRRYVTAVNKNGGVSTPEMRLPSAQAGGILVVLSFLWLGWTGYQPGLNPIISALSGVPQGVASILIFRSLQTYFIDAYEQYAASAIAANVVARSVFGATFPLFASTMFTRLGVQWACTLLAGIMLILVPVPFYFERYGARLRRNSRFAPG